MDPKLDKWLRWLDALKVEVRALVIAKYKFHELQSIIKANPDLQQSNSFYSYLAQMYAAYVLSGMRRMVKIHKQSISFSRLLQEIVDHPEILTRQYYVGLYKGTVVEDLAEQDFDRFAKPGALHVDSELVEGDLTKLQNSLRNCEAYADRTVAHLDSRGPKCIPTYGELDQGVELLDGLWVKYYMLFHASHMDTLLPTWQYDWKSIFRLPWIRSEGGA